MFIAPIKLLMKQCLIDGCNDEARLISKSSGISYYSCKKHEKQVAQIAAAEHTKGEMERIKKQNLFHLSPEKNPEWMKI